MGAKDMDKAALRGACRVERAQGMGKAALLWERLRERGKGMDKEALPRGGTGSEQRARTKAALWGRLGELAKGMDKEALPRGTSRGHGQGGVVGAPLGASQMHGQGGAASGSEHRAWARRRCGSASGSEARRLSRERADGMDKAVLQGLFCKVRVGEESMGMLGVGVLFLRQVIKMCALHCVSACCRGFFVRCVWERNRWACRWEWECCSFDRLSRSRAVHAACFCHVCCRFIWIGAGDRQTAWASGRDAAERISGACEEELIWGERGLQHGKACAGRVRC